MQPSRRSRIETRPNPLAVALSERARRGVSHLDLTAGNPTTAGIPYDLPAIQAALSGAAGRPYEPLPFGLPRAREAVSRLWEARGIRVAPERVCLTSSTSEAYASLLKLLCDPGDEVLVPQPSYPLFDHLMRYEGVQPVPYRIEYDGAFHVDLASVTDRLGPRTRAVVTVTPNNPTGSILKRSELERLAGLGVPIVSDEVFGDYRIAPGEGAVRSALEATDAVVFSLDGLSKTAALPHMKLAWITLGGPEHAIRQLLEPLELILDTFLSPSGPVQHALPALLEAGGRSRAATFERVQRNDRTLRELFEGSPVTPLPVEGGWYAVVKLPAVKTEEAWILGLLEDRDVLVQPGWFYDFATEPFAVVSLLTEETVLAEGARRIAEYVTRTA